MIVSYKGEYWNILSFIFQINEHLLLNTKTKM